MLISRNLKLPQTEKTLVFENLNFPNQIKLSSLDPDVYLFNPGIFSNPDLIL